MLEQVDSVSEMGATLSLLLADISNGYSLQGIDGLDPVPANIVSSSFARLDGDQFQSARREKRNLIIKIGLEPDYTDLSAQQLRTNLYQWFMPKMKVLNRFYAEGMPPLEINGIVESFDCPLFVKEPVATISIINHDPDFVDPEVMTFGGFSNNAGAYTDVAYSGSVDAGIKIQFHVDRTLTAFDVWWRSDSDASAIMPIVGSFIDGDEITLSTEPGNKYLTLNRGGVESSILYALSPFSDWIKFIPGNNRLRVHTTGIGIDYDVEFNNRYGGL